VQEQCFKVFNRCAADIIINGGIKETIFISFKYQNSKKKNSKTANDRQT